MATKKAANPLFSAKHEQTNDSRKPTILQFVKRLPKETLEHKSVVRVIWLPGGFDNYTLESTDYRISINPHHPLYDAIVAGIDELTRGNRTLYVCITNKSPLAFQLLENEDLEGSWHTIGADSGYRYYPTNLAEENEW